jgi:hypothetical protein
MLTAQLGTSQSAAGAVQPGFFCTGTGVYHGPFTGEITLGETPTVVQPWARLAVSQTVASQLALSDPSWWDFH